MYTDFSAHAGRRIVNTYDQLLYINLPYAQTHPSRLYVIARLAGLDPAPIENCRVLEIGASEGANLAGMALVLPSAEFFGFDLAAEPVIRGCRAISDLGLKNVHLEQMDIMDANSSLGKFDYIVAHGVYAWTPQPVRDKILAVVREHLNPQGVAYVSYNVFPTGHVRSMFRDMMLYATRGIEDPKEKLEKARAWLRVMAGGRPEPDTLDAAVAQQASELLERGDSALFHDELSEAYQPVYFHEFVEHAAQHRLQYFGEANPVDQLPRNLTREARDAVNQFATDRIAHEQFLDFLRMRSFRQSLLCHAENPILADWDAKRAAVLYAASSTHEETDGAFVSPNGTRMTTTHPAPVEYLRRLIGIWPRSEAVSADHADLARDLFRAGLLELHGFPGIAVPASDRPQASPLARYQAARGDARVTTLWHRSVEVLGEPARKLFEFLDGAHDRDSIAAEMQCSREVLDAELDKLAKHGLFIQ